MQYRRWLIALGAGVLTLSGCQQPGKVKPDAAAAPAPPTTADPADAAAAEAQAHVQSLRDALGHSPAGDEPRIAWINPDAKAAKLPVVPTTATGTPDANAHPAPDKPAAAATSKPTTVDAYAILLDHLKKDHSLTPLGRAVAAVTLTAAMPDQRWDDAAMLAPLRSYERDGVERYRAVVASLHAKVAAGSTLDRRTVVTELDAMFDHAPVRITTVKLCRRVQGFGAYDEIDPSALVAGRDRRMIAYVELDDYRALPGGGPDGQFEVRLAQEIELYNESDGLAVWRVKPVEIVDHCRNRRRDFFVVQLLELPPRLNVGKYVLKIRVTDQHGGSVDERTLPIAIVADNSMVSGK